MHHRQPLAEDVHASQAAALEDVAAPVAFEERQSQQHDHLRTEVERMSNELLSKLVRRIGDDCLDLFGQAFHEEVAPREMRRLAVVDEVACQHPEFRQHAAR